MRYPVALALALAHAVPSAVATQFLAGCASHRGDDDDDDDDDDTDDDDANEPVPVGVEVVHSSGDPAGPFQLPASITIAAGAADEENCIAVNVDEDGWLVIETTTFDCAATEFDIGTAYIANGVVGQEHDVYHDEGACTGAVRATTAGTWVVCVQRANGDYDVTLDLRLSVDTSSRETPIDVEVPSSTVLDLGGENDDHEVDQDCVRFSAYGPVDITLDGCSPRDGQWYSLRVSGGFVDEVTSDESCVSSAIFAQGAVDVCITTQRPMELAVSLAQIEDGPGTANAMCAACPSNFSCKDDATAELADLRARGCDDAADAWIAWAACMTAPDGSCAGASSCGDQSSVRTGTETTCD